MTNDIDIPADDRKPAERAITKGDFAAVILCLLPIIAVFFWTTSTATFTLEQYNQVGSWEVRGFRIAGTVEATGRAAYHAVHMQDRGQMHLCRITDGAHTAVVWYDPARFPNPPAIGEHVEITGSFDTIISTRIGQGTGYETFGIAESIEVVEPTAPHTTTYCCDELFGGMNIEPQGDWGPAFANQIAED